MAPFNGDLAFKFWIPGSGDDSTDDEQQRKQRERIPPTIFATIRSPEKKNIYDRGINYKISAVGSVVKLNPGKQKYGEYELCLTNKNKEETGVMFAIAEFDEKTAEERQTQRKEVEVDERKDFIRKQSLSPVEKTFDNVKTLTDNVITEMDYIKTRESRMHKTSESTSARVHWFSLLSILVLIMVGSVQVLYMKSYFMRKKLL